MTTPRTDAAVLPVPYQWDGSIPVVPADFARQLERENAALVEALIEMTKCAEGYVRLCHKEGLLTAAAHVAIKVADAHAALKLAKGEG